MYAQADWLGICWVATRKRGPGGIASVKNIGDHALNFGYKYNHTSVFSAVLLFFFERRKISFHSRLETIFFVCGMLESERSWFPFQSGNYTRE